METLEPSNLVADEWVPAADGRTFELRRGSAPAGGRRRWPRSGAADVERALAAAEAAGPAWSSLPRGERVRRLVGFHGRLEAAADADELAACLGLEPDEIRPRLEDELFRLREGLELLSEGRDGEGAGVFQAHWSDLIGGLGTRLAVRLVAGHTAVLIADPRLPEVGHTLARAACEAELPVGVVSVLHDDTGEALRAGLAHAGLAWARLRGTDEELEGLEARSGAFPASWSVWPLRNTSRIVVEGDDVAVAAGDVLEATFGRASTLSGQLPGQVGRVICHQRLFSRFSAELLRGLEALPGLGEPAPAVESDLLEHVRNAWALGLDEGATPIFGGEPFARASEATSCAGRRVIGPVVFTNVEPGQGLARLGRPAPVLALLRASSDEEARRLAHEPGDSRGRGGQKGLQQGITPGGRE